MTLKDWRIRAISLLFLLILAVNMTNAAAGQRYAPTGLYDVEYFTLANGLDVVLKRKTHAHSVAIRLVVNVGKRHSPCGKREIAHFLEHLLFMGTEEHSEMELDRLIEGHGGAWNAFTGGEQTIYKIEIYDQYLPLALDTLHEIITKSVLTPEKFARARDVIHRELGSKPSPILRWLYSHDIGKSAQKKAIELLYAGGDVVCSNLETLDDITQTDVKAAYTTYYVPNNMGLVIVGNFDRAKVGKLLRDSFGKMPRGKNKLRGLKTPPYPEKGAEVSGTFSPILDRDGRIEIAYRTVGEASTDYWPLAILDYHLSRVLYEKIRVEKALSYGPKSKRYTGPDYGVFVLSADANLNDINQVKVLLVEELDRLRTQGITEQNFENVKTQLLLFWAQGYESNAGMADYYAENLYELRHKDRLVNHEALIDRLIPSDVQQVVTTYFRDDRAVVVWNVPTITYTQLYIGLAIMTVLLAVGLGYMYRYFHRKRR